MENNRPAQRTTICINEAFNFLELPEYGITDNTSPEIIIMKRAASESGIKGNNHVLNLENMPRKFNGFVSEQDKRSNQISDQNRDENVELQNHLENNLILDPKKGDNPSMEDNKCKGDNPIMEDNKCKGDNPTMEDNKFKGDNPTMEDNKCKGDNPSMEDNECKGGNLEQECNIGNNLVLEYIKRDNLAQNSTTSGNDDCDSGYSNRSSFIDVESENSRKLLEASEDVNMFKVAVNSDCSTDTDTVNGDVNIVSNNSDQKHETLVIQSIYYVENGKSVTQSSDYDENEKSLTHSSDYVENRKSVTHSSDYVENRKSVTHSSDSVVNGKSVTHSNDSVVNGQPVTHSSDYVVDGKSVTHSSDYVVPVNGCDDDKPLNVEEEEEAVRLRPKSVTSPIDQKRGTTQIVSDAFSFLKDVDISEEVCNKRRSSGYKSSHFPDDDMLGVTNDGIDKSADYTYQVDNGKQTKGERSIDKGNNPTDQEVNKDKVKSLKRQKSHKEMDEDQNSGDSSDEDTGIYNESFRKSCWIFIDDHHQPVMQDSIDEVDENDLDDDNNKTDDVFLQNKLENNRVIHRHNRTDSTTTTASESEFKRSFQSRRKCFVQRNDSQQEYERMSRRVFENEKIITLEKKSGDKGFGLHILDTHPVMVSGIGKDSPASRAGIKEGQILLTVNGVSVLEADHDSIISLVQQTINSGKRTLQVEVATTDLHYIRDMQKPVISGYLYKQKGSTFLRSWKKRYCVLRQDNCLYYFKTQVDVDPLGAIPMFNYTVSRHVDSSKDNCFKAEKYGAKTYYFSVDSREEMAKWVVSMNEASMTSKKRKDSWMDVTSHNVGLPALEVRNSECSGNLLKCGRTTKTWQKRYCILKDACIYYYKNMYSPRAQGMAHLHGYTIHDSSKKFSFTLKPPELQMKQFTFAADNETDQKRWVEALSKSVNRWIKVD